jgi:hypothetical protein
MTQQQEEPLTTADMAGTSDRDVDSRADRDTNATARTDERRDRSNATTEEMNSQQTPLFPSDEAEGFKSRWMSIQVGFVDEPRRSVEQADSLIAEVMKSLAASFAEERENLEGQWDQGDDVSTEDLRVALQRYRSFFDRLLSL